MVNLWQLIILICAICLAQQNTIAQIDDTKSKIDSIPTKEKSVGSNDITPLVGETLVQDSTSTVDSTVVKKERFKLLKSILDNKYPNPNRAAAMSLLLPGAGQVYNKKYWKLPFVYGALGGLGYMAYFNNDRYKTFRDAYLAEVDEDPDTINQFPTLDENALLTQRDRFNKRRQQGYVFFVLGWILNSVDAYVDAHLASFDVNEDISGHIQPIGIFIPGEESYGLSLILTTSPLQKEHKKFIF